MLLRSRQGRPIQMEISCRLLWLRIHKFQELRVSAISIPTKPPRSGSILPFQRVPAICQSTDRSSTRFSPLVPATLFL